MKYQSDCHADATQPMRVTTMGSPPSKPIEQSRSGGGGGDKGLTGRIQTVSSGAGDHREVSWWKAQVEGAGDGLWPGTSHDPCGGFWEHGDLEVKVAHSPTHVQ